MRLGDCLRQCKGIKLTPISWSFVLYCVVDWERSHFMRATKRFEIRCPVTLHLSNRENDKSRVQGMLRDIGIGGARLALDQPVPEGAKIILYVHFSAPERPVTTIRFEGIVQRLHEEPRFEVAVIFNGSARFLRNQLSDLHGKKASNPGKAA